MFRARKEVRRAGRTLVTIHNNIANYLSTTAIVVDQLMVLYVSQMAVEIEVQHVELFNTFGD